MLSVILRSVIVASIKNNAGYVPHWLPSGIHVNHCLVPVRAEVSVFASESRPALELTQTFV